MTAQDRREQRLKMLDDHIGRSLAESEKRGELRAAPSYGKPLELGAGYAETPDEFRVGFKILKDAGVVPAEVELMQQIDILRRSLDGAADSEGARAQRRRLVDMQQALALRMERLRGGSV